MKINLNLPARKLNSTFNYNSFFGIVLLLCCSMVFGFSQPIKKTFVKEIEVSEDAKVLTNTPRKLELTMSGKMTVNNLKGEYVLFGRGEEAVLRVNKNFEINTWEKNVIRQEVEIVVFPEDRQEAQNLMDALEIEIRDDRIGGYHIDGNMNLSKMEMRNGFFSSDQTHFVLSNGEKYQAKGIQIKTKLTIPKSNSLQIKGEYSNITLGDLEGELELYVKHCDLRAGNINTVNGTFTNCDDVYFQAAKTANFSAKNSSISIEEGDKLRIGFKSMSAMTDLPFTKNTNSSLNKYHFKRVNELLIAESANDEFSIDEIDHLEIPQAVFSNFKIIQLNKTLSAHISSGDLKISKVNAGFESININNKTSTVSIGTASDCSYKLNAYRNNISEYSFPKSAKKIDSKDSSFTTFLKGDAAKAGIIDIRCEQCKVAFVD